MSQESITYFTKYNKKQPPQNNVTKENLSKMPQRGEHTHDIKYKVIHLIKVLTTTTTATTKIIEKKIK